MNRTAVKNTIQAIRESGWFDTRTWDADISAHILAGNPEYAEANEGVEQEELAMLILEAPDEACEDILLHFYADDEKQITKEHAIEMFERWLCGGKLELQCCGIKR